MRGALNDYFDPPETVKPQLDLFANIRSRACVPIDELSDYSQ